MKIIKVEVEKCADCPYIRKESPNRGVCGHSDGHGLSDLIAILLPLPSWCPLEDAPEEIISDTYL
jgi:hypothetical protein